MGGVVVGGEGEDIPSYRHFGVAVATWCSYKAPIHSYHVQN